MCEGILFRIFLGFFLYLCTHTAGTKAEYSLWLDPAKVVVRHGDPVSVTCNTTAEKYEIMDWEVSQGKSIRVTDQKLIWNVSSLTEWNINPSCYITVDSLKGIQFEMILNLTIYKIPDSVSISTVGDIGEMIEGQQYELQCDVKNVAPVKFLTVNWYKGDTLVDSTSFTDSIKTPQTLSHTLQITPRRDDHGDQYTCVAVLELGPDGPQLPPTVTSDPFNITVHYGPELNCLDYFRVIEGVEFQPNCMAEGYPPPELNWFKDGESVDFPQTMYRTDAGRYNVIAKNTFNASHMIEFEIEVLYPPTDISELTNKQTSHGFDEILKCSSKANPRPKYRWEYKHASNVRIVNEDEVSGLFIDYPTGQNTGTYTCIAHNEYGTVNKSATFKVTEDPDRVSLSTVDHTGPMVEGRQYELRCDVKFVAPAHLVTIMVYKGDQLIKTFDDSFQANSNKTAVNRSTTCQISIDRADNGTQYRCEAELKVTPEGPSIHLGQSAPLSVTVHYKPVINTAKLPSVVPVFRGYPEVLVCEAEGYPHPTITWTKKLRTEVEGGNLTISEATNENVGLYNCTATNSVDSTVRVVKVIMKEDYLPLIAGIVALVVVGISVIFVVFYSIYYKNTKMGRYTVEGASPSAQNGNVAQNGKVTTIPMKKIPQNSV